MEKVVGYLQNAPSGSLDVDAAAALDEGIAKLNLDGDSGSSSISVTCGRLAKLATLLDQPDMTDLASEIGRLLQDARPLRAVKPACDGLPEEELLYSLGKVSRAVDRVRSRLVKIIDRAKQGTTISPDLINGANGWLGASFDMIESLLLGPCSQVEYHERHADLTAIAIDTAMSLSKSALVPSDSDSRERSLDLLNRSSHLFRTSRAPSSDLQDWARCLSNAAWSCGAGIYRLELFVPATPFIQMAVRLGNHALEVFQAGQSGPCENERDWVALQTIMSPRWEALSVCNMRAGKKMDSLTARIHCIQAQSDALEQIETETSSRPPFSLFAPTDKLSAVLSRLASVIIGEALFFSQAEERFEDAFFADITFKFASAAMAEHLVACMQHVEYRPEVAALMQALLLKTKSMYSVLNCPIREARSVGETNPSIDRLADLFDFIEQGHFATFRPLSRRRCACHKLRRASGARFRAIERGKARPHQAIIDPADRSPGDRILGMIWVSWDTKASIKQSCTCSWPRLPMLLGTPTCSMS